MNFLWFKEKRMRKKLPITAPASHKIPTLRGITSGDGSLGLELNLACYTLKSGVVRMEWSQETIMQFIDGYKKKTIIWERNELGTPARYCSP
jgi:hypothetical protein